MSEHEARPRRQATLQAYQAKKDQDKARSAPSYPDYVGRRVGKAFEDPCTGRLRPFSGTVTSFRLLRVNCPWFFVTYEDDDAEEVSLKELLAILVPEGTPPACQQQQQQQGSGSRGQKRGAAQATACGAAAGPSQGHKRAKGADVERRQQRFSQEAAMGVCLDTADHPATGGGQEATAGPASSEGQKRRAGKGSKAKAAPVVALAAATAMHLLEPQLSLPSSAGVAAAPSDKVAVGKYAGAAGGSAVAAVKKQKRAAGAEAAAAAAGMRHGQGSSKAKRKEVAPKPEVPVQKGKGGSSKAGGSGSGKAGGSGSGKADGSGSSKAGGSGSGKAGGSGNSKAGSKQKGGGTKETAGAGSKGKQQGKGSRGAGAAPDAQAAMPRKRSSSAKEPPVELAPVGERQRTEYEAGSEPWRSIPHFKTPVLLEQELSLESRKAVSKCKEVFYRRFRKAEVEEDERVTKAEGRGEKGETLTKRPDRVTESWMKKGDHAIHQSKVVGFLPGIAVNDGFYSRAELAVCGMHHPPVAGIAYVGANKAGKGVPSFAVSVVASGVYEDDGDHGHEFIYTGEGGNDLLGNRKQNSDQKLERGNLALVGSIRLGLPVRVVRKNKDPTAPLSQVLIFDGLYDVVEYWSELGIGKTLIYRFRLIRRAGQGPLLSQKVTWGGISAPKEVTAFARNGVVDIDIAGGKERLAIWAVNETEDGQIPPCASLDRLPEQCQLKGAHLGVTEERLEELRRSWQPSVEYVTGYVYGQGVPRPQPPVLPPQFRGCPHKYIAQLNHGRLPYHQSKPGRAPTLTDLLPVVYECGPWCGCELGAECPQAASQQGLRYRLEVFRKSDGQGWGVRNLDMIPQWSFICNYYGDVYPAQQYDEWLLQGYDGSYCTDLAPRPDVDWQSNRLETKDSSQHAKYVVCGLKRRNIGALLNHSCDPNVFVQPVLSEHHNAEMPGIAMFAMKDIPPLTELTWDYGEHYVLHQLDNKCKCDAEDCLSKQPQK